MGYLALWWDVLTAGGVVSCGSGIHSSRGEILFLAPCYVPLEVVDSLENLPKFFLEKRGIHIIVVSLEISGSAERDTTTLTWNGRKRHLLLFVYAVRRDSAEAGVFVVCNSLGSHFSSFSFRHVERRGWEARSKCRKHENSILEEEGNGKRINE